MRAALCAGMTTLTERVGVHVAECGRGQPGPVVAADPRLVGRRRSWGPLRGGRAGVGPGGQVDGRRRRAAGSAGSRATGATTACGGRSSRARGPRCGPARRGAARSRARGCGRRCRRPRGRRRAARRRRTCGSPGTRRRPRRCPGRPASCPPATMGRYASVASCRRTVVPQRLDVGELRGRPDDVGAAVGAGAAAGRRRSRGRTSRRRPSSAARRRRPRRPPR